jgi:hypothetical protein
MESTNHPVEPLPVAGPVGLLLFNTLLCVSFFTFVVLAFHPGTLRTLLSSSSGPYHRPFCGLSALFLSSQKYLIIDPVACSFPGLESSLG